VTAVLRLVRDDDGDGGLPPLEAFEIQMRGAGRSPRYICHVLSTLAHLQEHSGKAVSEIGPIACLLRPTRVEGHSTGGRWSSQLCRNVVREAQTVGPDA
jgi:hypothetical protein